MTCDRETLCRTWMIAAVDAAARAAFELSVLNTAGALHHTRRAVFALAKYLYYYGGGE